MKKMSLYLVLVIFSFSTNLLAAKKKTIEGKFVKVVWGDYQHLVINSDGKELSLWCEDTKPLDCDELEKKESFYKDKILKLTYENVSSFVQEAGKMINRDMLVSIELKK